MGSFRSAGRGAACVAALLAACGPAAAQVMIGPVGPVVPWYNPVVTPYGAWGYGYYPYGAYGGTAFSNDAQALAEALRAQGEYNRATAQAQVELQEARSQYIENQQKWLAAYREHRRLGEERRAEEIAAARDRRLRYQSQARQRQPELLGRNEYNAATGELYFPDALQGPEYDAARQRLQDLFAIRARSGGNAKTDSEIVEVADAMLATLNRQIDSLHAPDYIAAHEFLVHARNVGLLGS